MDARQRLDLAAIQDEKFGILENGVDQMEE